MDGAPEPENYSEKEVYAFFGLAAYSAQVLEKGLVNMVVAFQTFGARISRDEFDQIFSQHDSKTLGQLMQRARLLKIPISDETDQLLSVALAERNFLNHNFFAEHAGHFATETGRRTMINRLSDLIRMFQGADRHCDAIYVPLLERMGVTDESIEKHVQAIIKRGTCERTPTEAEGDGSWGSATRSKS